MSLLPISRPHMSTWSGDSRGSHRNGPTVPMRLSGHAVSSHPRPLLLGYIRASVLRSAAEIPKTEAELEAFVDREDFSLGPVFTETGGAPGAFHALMEELARNDTVRGVLIPDLRHLSCDEQLILSRHEQGAQTPVLVVNFAPLAGGPGADSPACAGSALTVDQEPEAKRRPIR